jgi:hypothetical protein
LCLAIVINIEISRDRIIRVFDIISIDDISVILFIIVYGDIKSMLIINITITGIKMCQYILKFSISGMHKMVIIVSSIY